MVFSSPKYHLELTEEQLVLMVAMLGVALDTTSSEAGTVLGEEVREVMLSLAASMCRMKLPTELREVLLPAIHSLQLSLVGGRMSDQPVLSLAASQLRVNEGRVALPNGRR